VTPPQSGIFDRLRIVVADEDPKVVAFVIDTLRADGHAVFHAYDVLAAVQLAAVQLAVALEPCDLLLSNTRVQDVDGVDLIHRLRQKRPNLPILYLANAGRSTPEVEAQLPGNVPILREPFTEQELRSAVTGLLEGESKKAR
jgi:DNA-binding response OmpR family regulator